MEFHQIESQMNFKEQALGRDSMVRACLLLWVSPFLAVGKARLNIELQHVGDWYSLTEVVIKNNKIRLN